MGPSTAAMALAQHVICITRERPSRWWTLDEIEASAVDAPLFGPKRSARRHRLDVLRVLEAAGVVQCQRSRVRTKKGSKRLSAHDTWSAAYARECATVATQTDPLPPPPLPTPLPSILSRGKGHGSPRPASPGIASSASSSGDNVSAVATSEEEEEDATEERPAWDTYPSNETSGYVHADPSWVPSSPLLATAAAVEEDDPPLRVDAWMGAARLRPLTESPNPAPTLLPFDCWGSGSAAWTDVVDSSALYDLRASMMDTTLD